MYFCLFLVRPPPFQKDTNQCIVGRTVTRPSAICRKDIQGIFAWWTGLVSPEYVEEWHYGWLRIGLYEYKINYLDRCTLAGFRHRPVGWVRPQSELARTLLHQPDSLIVISWRIEDIICSLWSLLFFFLLLYMYVHTYQQKAKKTLQWNQQQKNFIFRKHHCWYFNRCASELFNCHKHVWLLCAGEIRGCQLDW